VVEKCSASRGVQRSMSSLAFGIPYRARLTLHDVGTLKSWAETKERRRERTWIKRMCPPVGGGILELKQMIVESKGLEVEKWLEDVKHFE
jgi:hypothetical protein